MGRRKEATVNRARLLFGSVVLTLGALLFLDYLDVLDAGQGASADGSAS